MLRYIVHITDPSKEQEVEQLLEGISGIEVQRDPAKPKRSVKRVAKRKLTTQEEKFVKELRQAMKEVKDHISGKKKLGLARDLLHEL